MGGNALLDQMRLGDWICDSCGFSNFAKNDACKKCRAPRKNIDFPARKAGACARFCIRWMLGSCKNMERCTFTHAPHELTCARDLRQGSWLCSKCGFVLPRIQIDCRKCKVARNGGSLAYDERRGDFTRNLY